MNANKIMLSTMTMAFTAFAMPATAATEHLKLEPSLQAYAKDDQLADCGCNKRKRHNGNGSSKAAVANINIC